MPVPKARNKARYSLVLIGATGQSRQLELTPWRIRLGLGIAVCALCIVVATLMLRPAAAPRSEKAQDTRHDETLVTRINQLQEELRQKDLALNVQEKRLKEMQELPTLVTAQRPAAGASTQRSNGEHVAGEDDGPLLALHEGTGNVQPTQPSTQPTDRDATGEDVRSPGSGISEGGPDTVTPKEEPISPPIINFNAQLVTAATINGSSGTLSFQLVKDRHDIRFAGYLFVVVEMAEGKENKIYAYPKRAQLGEEGLPADFREGESVAFKYNSRVELPYNDRRPGAHLERVSILLYGQNGKIVFQRGFDRKEVKIVNTKAGSEGRTASGEKRRAL